MPRPESRAPRDRRRIAAMGAVVALAVGCVARSPALAPPVVDVPVAPSIRDRAYVLTWRGARIGEARERVRWTAAGVELTRRERVLLRRGDRVIATETEVTIETDPALIARVVTWVQRDAEGTRARRARPDADGWRVDDAARRPAAVPVELVPLLVARDGAFTGDVLLAARGWAIAPARARAIDADHWDLAIGGADAVPTRFAVDRDGAPVTVVDGDGVVARAADEATLALPFTPPDAVDAGAIAIRATAPRPADAAVRLRLDGIVRAPPPDLPDQRVVADGDTWRVELHAPVADDAALRAMADAIAAAIAPDLGRTARTFADARTADAGDCTTHALAFVDRARRAGVPARVVTGYRVDGDRLVRHRWALAWTGARWLALDPSYPAAQAAPLLGLDVRDDDDLDRADRAFDGMSADAIAE